MNPALSDAAPLTPQFLALLSQFLEQQHGGPGQGDISQTVKAAIQQQSEDDKPASDARKESGQTYHSHHIPEPH